MGWRKYLKLTALVAGACLLAFVVVVDAERRLAALLAGLPLMVVIVAVLLPARVDEPVESGSTVTTGNSSEPQA